MTAWCVLYVCVAWLRAALSPKHRAGGGQSHLSVFNQALDTDSLPWERNQGRDVNQDSLSATCIYTIWIYRPVLVLTYYCFFGGVLTVWVCGYRKRMLCMSKTRSWKWQSSEDRRENGISQRKDLDLCDGANKKERVVKNTECVMSMCKEKTG